MRATGNFEACRNVDPMVVLNDATRAHKCLRAVLAAQPENRKALALQVRLHTAAGKHGEALALLRKLIDSASDPAERAGLLLELAAAEEREGKHEQSVQTLGEALAFEGPGGMAEQAYRERIGTHATYEGYVEALRRFLKGQIARGQAGGATVLLIARAQVEGLRDRSQAKATLREGVKWLPDERADLFFVTLVKSEEHYSPTTMYADRAITDLDAAINIELQLGGCEKIELLAGGQCSLKLRYHGNSSSCHGYVEQ